MEFWGVEVKGGEPVKVTPEDGQIIHISQAAMGEGKKGKGNEHIPLIVKIDGKKFVVGSLSGHNFPQITFDLVFEKEFELSHDWKNGTVYFCGYLADNSYSEGEDYDSIDSSEEEDAPVGIIENGKPAAIKGKAGKPESSAKAKVTVVEPKKEEESDEDDSEDEDMINASDGSSDSEDEDDSDEDDSQDEDEETPKKAVSDKKRLIKSKTITPVAAKNAKSDTPQKTDSKKGGGHTATPHPSKTGKTPANSNKSKEKTPKSDAKVSCKSCDKTFSSGTGLESHTKAKHSGK